MRNRVTQLHHYLPKSSAQLALHNQHMSPDQLRIAKRLNRAMWVTTWLIVAMMGWVAFQGFAIIFQVLTA